MSHRLFICVALGLFVAGLLAGCESEIRPLKPLQRVELWVPSDGSPAIELAPPTTLPAPGPALARAQEPAPGESPATQSAASQTSPATSATSTIHSATTTPAAPATAPTQLAATAPATQVAPSTPGQKVIKIIDPNETTRFIYKATYDNIWQQATLLLDNMGFTLDRHDYRLGVLITQPLPSAQVIEFWKPQQTSAKNALENTINSQRRIVRLTIAQAPGKPDFYQIAVQVLVERQTNPSEAVGGPVFVEGSGFGRSGIALRTDYVAVPELPRWVTLGHDPELERKVLDELFKRI